MKKIIVKIQVTINPNQMLNYVVLFGVPCLVVGVIIYNAITYGVNPIGLMM